jgi:hypothetical protein
MATPEQIANQDLARKLKLERSFKPRIVRLFNAMLRANKNAIIKTGSTLSASKWTQAWITLLSDQYKATQGEFAGVVPNSQKAMLTNWFFKQGLDEQDNGITEDDLLAAFLLWRVQTSTEHAGFITETNQNDIDSALDIARQSLLEEDEPIDNTSLAIASTAVLKRNFNGRVSSIAMTETQAAAESAKWMEASAMQGIDPRNVIGTSIPVMTTTKRWATVGDNKVRPDHVNANGQVRQASKAFDVGGQKLKYPGDSSLGATIEQTGN